MASSSSSVSWTDLSDDELTVELVQEKLACVDDDLWVATACLDRVLNDAELQRELLKLGISRTDEAARRAKATSSSKGDDKENLDSRDELNSLKAYLGVHPEDAQLCAIRAVLLRRLSSLECYCQVAECMEDVDTEDDTSTDGGWEDDPWANEFDTGSIRTTKSRRSKTQLPVPLPLSAFLTQHPLFLCMALASQTQFNALQALLKGTPSMSPCRFAILDNIPLFSDPSAYRELLPSVDSSTGNEQMRGDDSAANQEDWSHDAEVVAILKETVPWVEEYLIQMEVPPDVLRRELPLSGDEISQWYKARVNDVLRMTGMADISLNLIQHGISLGVPSLDEVGEDLTLLSRIVYDVHGSSSDDSHAMSLEEWSALSPREIIRLYLSTSTPNSVVNDIQRLVSPYLFVLESRAERTGKPDPNLAKSHLYQYILTAPLHLLLPIFEASKPTLIASRRIVSDDEDIARLALSCLYGYTGADEWSQMSRIFECLPAWSFDNGVAEDDEVDATLISLTSYLSPSTSRPQGAPSELFQFFKPLPALSLSKALDILDVHLESGEILAKWGAPATLQWLLESSRNETLQRAWAMKLVRTCNSELDSQEEWLTLLEDMLKMARPEGSDKRSNSAFGALSSEDIRKIFFNGLLSAGNFPMAKSLVRPFAGEVLLGEDDVEKICLDCSREFYDNATNGNYNFGDMKLAFDCLSVPRSTTEVEREREFIEATSRISSYNIMSRPGVPLLPIDIRLTKDRLSLISRVLSSSQTAYKHVEVILDLVRKLGYRGDTLAEVKTLAMIAETALQAEDFDVAYQTSDRMVNTVLQLKASSVSAESETPQVSEAIEVCWVSCLQLGRHPEADDTDKKLYLLGRALELCPADKIVDILSSWRKIEEESIERRNEVLNDRKSADSSGKRQTRGRTTTLASKLQNFHLTSPSLPSAPDAAAIASQALNRVAASLPFSISGRDRSGSREGSRRRAGSPDVQAQARQALQRGIGWLIGADENDL